MNQEIPLWVSDALSLEQAITLVHESNFDISEWDSTGRFCIGGTWFVLVCTREAVFVENEGVKDIVRVGEFALVEDGTE